MLSNPDKRARYDQFGHAGMSGAAGGGFEGFGQGMSMDDISLCSVTSSVDMEEVSEALEVSAVADVPHNASSVVQTSV